MNIQELIKDLRQWASVEQAGVARFMARGRNDAAQVCATRADAFTAIAEEIEERLKEEE